MLSSLNKELKKSLIGIIQIIWINNIARDFLKWGIIFQISPGASFFVQVISFIEFELKELCMFHEEQNKPLIKFSDLKGADEFEKIKKYLKGSGNIDFSLLDPEWGYIKKMKILRNRFVHHYGTIDKEDRDRYRTILEIVNSEKSITFMENSLRDKKIDDFD